MAEESTRAGLFVPYPLLGIMLTLVMALGGGIVGLYSQISAMNTTMILRDSDYQRQVRELKEKADQMEVYLHNDRERIARLEAERTKRN